MSRGDKVGIKCAAENVESAGCAAWGAGANMQAQAAGSAQRSRALAYGRPFL